MGKQKSPEFDAVENFCMYVGLSGLFVCWASLIIFVLAANPNNVIFLPIPIAGLSVFATCASLSQYRKKHQIGMWSPPTQEDR